MGRSTSAPAILTAHTHEGSRDDGGEPEPRGGKAQQMTRRHTENRNETLYAARLATSADDHPPKPARETSQQDVAPAKTTNLSIMDSC